MAKALRVFIMSEEIQVRPNNPRLAYPVAQTSHESALAGSLFAIILPLLIAVCLTPWIIPHLLTFNTLLLLLVARLGRLLRTVVFTSRLSICKLRSFLHFRFLVIPRVFLRDQLNDLTCQVATRRVIFYDAVLMSEDILNNFWHVSTNNRGYQTILALWFQIFGADLFSGLASINFDNNFLLANCSFRVETTGDVDTGKYTLVACILSPHFFSQGTILQKDIVIIFAFSLFLYSISCVLERGRFATPILSEPLQQCS